MQKRNKALFGVSILLSLLLASCDISVKPSPVDTGSNEEGTSDVSVSSDETTTSEEESTVTSEEESSSEEVSSSEEEHTSSEEESSSSEEISSSSEEESSSSEEEQSSSSSESSSSDESSSSSEEEQRTLYPLITENKYIADGTKVLIGNLEIGVMISSFKKSVASAYFLTESQDMTNEGVYESDSMYVVTIYKSANGYNLVNSEDKLIGATKEKSLAIDNSSAYNEWNISVDSKGVATIANTSSSIGNLYLNTTQNRFTTYKSQSSYKSPNLFLVKEAEPIYPTGISLSSSSATVRTNRTLQLNVTYEPFRANTDLDVAFESSNIGVATVSSTGLVTAVSSGSARITAKLVSNPTIKATADIVVPKQTTGNSYTILIYLCGADLESSYANESYYGYIGCATMDIMEILSVPNQPDNVNIVIETGGCKEWTKNSYANYGDYTISSTSLQRHHVEDGKLVLDQTLSSASMGKSSTLESFIEYGITEFPADRYGLILWNHGGALQGVCFDEKFSDDGLTPVELHTAVGNALKDTNYDKKLEWVGYDACLMGCQDIAELNSDYFNYMIASEESEVGYGWDYDNWIDNLYEDPSIDTVDLLSEICDTFIADNDGVTGRDEQCLSVLDLSYAAEYKEKFEIFASKLYSAVGSASKMQTLMDGVKNFSGEYYASFDTYNLLTRAKSSYSSNSQLVSAINDVLSVFNSYVAHNIAQNSAGEAHGITVFFINTYSTCISYSTYSSLSRFTNWKKIVNDYKYSSGWYY